MEKLIYVHVVRYGESPMARDAGNDWYVIKERSDGDDGVEMSRVFEDAGEMNHPDPVLVDTDCVVIGSCIYVTGGRCLLCEEYPYCSYRGSAKVRCLDARNPKDGWRTCLNLPFTRWRGKSAVVDDQWLYLFGGIRYSRGAPPNTWCYAFNVDNKAERKIVEPGNATCLPSFSTCLSPGALVTYMLGDNTLYQLDCKNSTWSVYDKDLPDPEYSSIEFGTRPAVVYDGILYSYYIYDMRLISYDLRSKKKLHVADLPRSICHGLNELVKLIALSEKRFCILKNRRVDLNDIDIYYSRFSVSYHLTNPCVVVEEEKVFRVAGSRVLNVVAVDAHADVGNGLSSSSRDDTDMAGGEKPI